MGGADIAVPAQASAVEVPLDQRPMLMVADIGTGAHAGLVLWMLVAMILLCFCPCTGPLPLGLLLVYLGWASRDDRYNGRVGVPTDEPSDCGRAENDYGYL